jgi:hypothetical protein
MGLCDSFNQKSKPNSNTKPRVNTNNITNGRYNFPNGDFYYGPLKNGLPDGIGTRYKPDGRIRYQGGFVNGCSQGKGKLIWDNGEYYDGDYVNNKRHGKGKVFYRDGKIKYDGDFANDKFDGYGKYIWENGEYYIGQWSNGLRHGKGAMYLGNGYLNYQGNFINDKYQGEEKTRGNNKVDNMNNSKVLQNGKGGKEMIEVNIGGVKKEYEYEDGYIIADIDSPFQKN